LADGGHLRAVPAGSTCSKHALRAIEAGDAQTIVLCAGDRIDRAEFRTLVDNYNRARANIYVRCRSGGPNSTFAFLTERHARANGLERTDYACVPLAQRAWAARNPDAVYRAPLSLDAYLAAPFVAPPLCRYDCVPVVAGADAIVLSAGPAIRHRSSAGASPVRAAQSR